MPVIHSPAVLAADRALEQRVALFLATRNTPSLRRLQIEVRGGTVTLRGRVSSYYEKQISHACSQRVPGVRRVVDEIEVFALPARSRRGLPGTDPHVPDTTRTRPNAPRPPVPRPPRESGPNHPTR